ncbi:aa3-type cytochrome c oxidase subunit IV [Methylovirgula sp. 4M-Z18]|nr:aa3-type cytochrome c oxidase subunit IV [Methylovirgula sp. 4M-Z18]RFB78364.1 aa3-type cytochrome c oxidase subunit IV [Methylovirgula sp. 4M-Z18]
MLPFDESTASPELSEHLETYHRFVHIIWWSAAGILAVLIFLAIFT